MVRRDPFDLCWLNMLDHGSSLGQLIKIIRESQMEFVVDKLTEFSSSSDEELRDISGLGRSHYS
jgi:hypothetical protein